MHNNLKIIIAIMVLASSCSNQRQERVAKKSDKVTIDTILIDDGIYLNFEYISDTSYILVWGKDRIKNISRDTFFTLPSGNLNLEWYDESAICLRQGCGTACFFTCILPLSQNISEIIYWYPVTYDQKNNLIAYSGTNDTLINIENYLTRRKTGIKEDFLPGPFNSYSIDSSSFISKELFIRWKDSKDNEIIRKIKINNLSD